MVLDKIIQIWKAKDLRNNILFVMAMLVIFRAAAHVPIPGVDVSALRDIFEGNQVLGLMNMFSGGSMQNFSVVMMGIAPYITASIIFQLLGMIIPSLEEMQKEEQGRQKITMWTRWLTVPLAAMQSFGMITLLRRSATGVLVDVSFFDLFAMIITITAGTIFLMWIGELITEKNIGNGISLLIFAGIISNLPQAISANMINFSADKIFFLGGFGLVALLTVIVVVIISEGQRNIPVQYAKQVRGGRTHGGSTTHLPLRVNMAGVIPIIFAISVVIFPSMIARFFMYANTDWVRNLANWTIEVLNPNGIVYAVVYFLLVFAFTFFYTEVVFHPDQIAENLQKQGGFIPGIRPGKNTADYLQKTIHKIVFVGALFLGVIAIMPLAMQYFMKDANLVVGGTSLLIVVSVVIETVKQIESQLSMREYEA